MAGGEKAMVVKDLLAAKVQSGKTFTQIAAEVGVTNAYAAQLFHRQAPLPNELEEPLRRAVPALSEDLLQAMKTIPMRSYDPSILQDPTIYRMSGIGFYCTVEKVKGKDGEDRVAVVFNGRFLPHVVQIPNMPPAKSAL